MILEVTIPLGDIADSIRMTASLLEAWSKAITNLSPDTGALVATPMLREAERLLDEANALDSEQVTVEEA